MKTLFKYISLIIITLVMSCAIANADCISGNCVNGNGTYIYANGDRYVGTFVNSAIEEGKYVWTNGDEYSGTFATNGFCTGIGNLYSLFILKNFFNFGIKYNLTILLTQSNVFSH